MSKQLCDVEVGDRLSVASGNRLSTSVPFTFRTAVKVTKTSIIDDTGQRWTMRGQKWGHSSSSYMWGEYLKVYDPSHEEANAEHLRRYGREIKCRKLANYNWSDASESVLDAVIALLKKDEA